MPRGARLDAPGTLHHVIVRGIERRKIVNDDTDRDAFVSRMGKIALETDTYIYAWALMTNHAHVLIRSGSGGLPTYMRRLLSGYAMFYNRRHRRYGHLFQNRYKSIICEEDVYFKELVRYIHLNPLRAGVVDTLAKLDRYKWGGHCVIVNRCLNEWQDRKFVLKWFGKSEKIAKKNYREFVRKGIDIGHRPDLTGGGLIRSMGGWSIVKAIRADGEKQLSDERILGSGEFVADMIHRAEERVKCQLPLVELQKIIEAEIKSACKKKGVSITILQSGSRRPPVPQLRKEIALKLVNQHGVSLAETARHLGISTSGVSQILRRGKQKRKV